MNGKKMYLIKRATLYYDNEVEDVLINPIHTNNVEDERKRIKEEYKCKKVYFHIDENIGKLIFHFNPDFPLMPESTVDDCIAAAFGINTEDLQRKTNKRKITEARWFAMWWHHRYDPNLSFASIGAMYANRSDTLAYQACKEFVPDLIQTNKAFRTKAYRALEYIESIKIN